MKTLTLLVALALATTTAAHAQSDRKHTPRPLLAASPDPKLEQARQQAIREQQARRHDAPAPRARKVALRKRARVQYVYRTPIVVTANQPAATSRP